MTVFMRSNRGRQALGLVLVAPLLAAAGPVDTSEWKCEFCPFEDGLVASAVEAGSLYAEGVDAKFGEFDGITEDGAYLVIDGGVGARQESGAFWRVDASDLGLDNGGLRATTGQEGTWRADLAYVASAHNVFDTTETPFVADGQSLVLPAGWVRAGNTQLMPELDASLHPVDIGTERERVSVGGEADLAAHWYTELRYSRETRDGRRLAGSNFVTTASQLAAPVDSVTDQVEGSLRYEASNAAIALSYLGSFFSNRRDELSWSNPFTAIAPGADLGRSAPAPDNDYNQLALSLNWRLGPGWRLGLNGTLGRATQDDPFLPYTTNPLVATDPLPRSSLDGQVDITHLNLQLNGDLGAQVAWLEGLSGRLNYRYYERDNETAPGTFEAVESDTFPAGPETSVAYGYRQQKLTLVGEYDLGRRLWPGHHLRLSGGWDRDEWDRSFQEASESTEDRGWVQLRASPLAWLSLMARYGAANRDTDPYLAIADAEAPQNPLLRKFNLADRERDFWEVGLDFTLPGSLTVALAGFGRKDDYVNSPIGLTGSRDSGGTADLSWAASEHVALFAAYGRQEIESRQAGSESFGTPDWLAEFDDRFETASIGVRLDRLRERWNIRFDYFYSDGRSDIEVQRGSAESFPPLRTLTHGPSLEAEFRASEALDVIGSFRYEHYDADDWALDGVGPATLPSVLASGANAYDHDATVLGLSFRYRFGGSGPSGPAPEDP